MNPEYVLGEYDDAGLGDARLDERLALVGARAAAAPNASFPKMFRSESELEGFYRLIRNPRAGADALVEPHIQATVDRATGRETVLAIHDTTEFRFKGERKGLGTLGKSGRGFFGHFSFLVEPVERTPLGVVSLHTWTRRSESPTAMRRRGEISYEQTTAMKSEQDRWGQQVDATELRVNGATSLVHVMDSEADDYALVSKLVEDGRRFIIRLCYDRVLDAAGSGSAPGEKTKAFVARSQEVCTRSVTLSRRQRRAGSHNRIRAKARKQRLATLSISATSVVFRRPSSQPKSLPKTVEVNIVRVSELNPPLDAEPVEWLLTTREPIETEAQILRVVDCYRDRWLIEEYFKALKTGCAYEKRELDSYDTLRSALAVLIPVAWGLLRVRREAQHGIPQSPSSVVTADQLEVLRLSPQCRLPKRPTPQDTLLAIARLGGHLRSNGPPGWQVLGRGYMELIALAAGYRLAQERM